MESNAPHLYDIRGLWEKNIGLLYEKGAAVLELERRVRQDTGASYCVAVNCAYSAFQMSFMALDIRRDNQVLMSPAAFPAAANAAVNCGAAPVFADIERETRNINPACAGAKITGASRAIIASSYGGHPCRMRELYEIAAENGVFIIEDATAAYLNSYLDEDDGKYYTSGNYGFDRAGSDCVIKASCFSLPAFSGIEDVANAAVIATNDAGFYEKCLLLRNCGISGDLSRSAWSYETLLPGHDFNLNDASAVAAINYLDNLPGIHNRAARIAAIYKNGLKNVNQVRVPFEKPYARVNWGYYSIALNFDCIGGQGRFEITADESGRNIAISQLRSAGIDCGVNYMPIYRHPYYRDNFKFTPADYPNTEEFWASCITLPLKAEMPDSEAEKNAAAVRSLFLP